MESDGFAESDRREELSTEALLRELTIQDVAEAWIRYQRTGPHGPVSANVNDRHPDWWAVDRWLTAEWWSDEDRVRQGILAIVDLAVTEDDFGIIGAAIMEEFITDDEGRLTWVEEHAASSDQFRRSLANVWIFDDVTDVSFARVELAAEVPLAVPKHPKSVAEKLSTKLILRMMSEGASEAEVVAALRDEGIGAAVAEEAFNRIMRPWMFDASPDEDAGSDADH